MTANQIAYAAHKENVRHNVVSETETNRHNVAYETETNRHNIITEQETSRHNLVTEQETQRANIAREELTRQQNLITQQHYENMDAENVRHNRVSEQETNRANIARETETHRSNVYNEALKQKSNNITEAYNVSRLELDEQIRLDNAYYREQQLAIENRKADSDAIKAQASKQQANAATAKVVMSGISSVLDALIPG